MYISYIYICIHIHTYKLPLVPVLSMRSSFQQNFQLEEPHQPGSQHLVVVDGVVIWRLGVRASQKKNSTEGHQSAVFKANFMQFSKLI